MKTRGELKAMAKQQIKGNIGGLFLILLLAGLISGILSIIPVVGSLASLVIYPALMFGVTLAFYKLSKDASYKPVASDVFAGFSNFSSAFRVY